MNVSGVKPYSGFYQYNSIKLNEVRNAQIAASEASAKNVPVEEPEQSKAQETVAPAVERKQTFSSYDYAQQYKPDETFDLKGVNSDIKSLDIDKVMSDLDKDNVLLQYQYFVESNPEGIGSSPVREDQNFML